MPNSIKQGASHDGSKFFSNLITSMCNTLPFKYFHGSGTKGPQTGRNHISMSPVCVCVYVCAVLFLETGLGQHKRKNFVELNCSVDQVREKLEFSWHRLL